MIRTILVPTDGSKHAGKAVILASDIAEKYGARLLILHVLPHDHVPEEVRHMAEVEHLAEPVPAGGPVASNIPTSAAAARHPARTDASDLQILKRVGERILVAAELTAEEKGVERVETRIEEGDPAEWILGIAEEEKVNLIVMGCRGLGNLKGLLIGSVSHKVSQLAPCTCVTVK